MSSSWHYMADGRKVGPFSSAELADLVRSGRIPPSTLVKESSRADWIPAVSVAAFFQRPPQLPSGPPPVIPAQPPSPPVSRPPVGEASAEPVEPLTGERVHPLTWMFVGVGIAAVATLFAAMLGFFDRQGGERQVAQQSSVVKEPGSVIREKPSQAT